MGRFHTHRNRGVRRRKTALPAGQEGHKAVYRPHEQPGGRHHLLLPRSAPEIRRDAAGHLDRHSPAGLSRPVGEVRRQRLPHTDHTGHNVGPRTSLHDPAPAVLGTKVGRPCGENDAGGQADDSGPDLDHRSGNGPEQRGCRHQCAVGYAGHRRHRLRAGRAGHGEEHLRRIHHLYGQAFRHRRHDQRERAGGNRGRRGHAQHADTGLRPAHHELSELQDHGRLHRQHLLGADAAGHGEAGADLRHGSRKDETGAGDTAGHPCEDQGRFRKSVGRHGLLLGLHRLGAGRHVLLLHREAGRRPENDVGRESGDPRLLRQSGTHIRLPHTHAARASGRRGKSRRRTGSRRRYANSELLKNIP